MTTRDGLTNSSFGATKIDPEKILEALTQLQLAVNLVRELIAPALMADTPTPIEHYLAEQEQWAKGK